MFTNERLFTIQAFTITRVHCIFLEKGQLWDLSSKPVILEDKAAKMIIDRPIASGGALDPQFLDKQLTLSQPGGQIMPTTVIQAPPWIFRPCDGTD